MKLPVLLESDRLPEFYRAVREQFNQGGSIGSVLIVIASLAALVLLVYVLNRLEGKTTTQTEPSDGKELFHDVLSRLDLSESQREWLDALASELQLKNPTVLLLSEQLFDHHVLEWLERREDRAAKSEPVVSRVRSRLFPGAAGFVSSADWVR